MVNVALHHDIGKTYLIYPVKSVVNVPMSQKKLRKCLTSAVMLINFSTTVMQIILIRELLIFFSGNELSIGVILANWLFLLTIGSYVSGKVADRFDKPWQIFISLQVLISLIFPLVIIEVRTMGNALGIPLGKTMGLITMFYSSFLILAQIAIIGGGLYTFSCKIYGSLNRSQEKFPGTIFSFESIGDMTSGFMVTFIFIPYFSSFQTAFFLATLNLSSAFIFLFITGSGNSSDHHKPSFFKLIRKNTSKIFVFILMVSTFSILISPIANNIHVLTLKAEWGGRNLHLYENSIYGNVAVTSENGQFTFFIDGTPFLSTPVPDVAFVEELVHLSMLYHPSPKNVLIIGGGAGGVLHEVLKYDIDEVGYVELDPLIIEAIEKHPTPLTSSEFMDPKLTIDYVDGRMFIQNPQKRYDVVIVNLPSPSTILLNRFYTKEFYIGCRDALFENGVLAIVTCGSEVYLSEEMSYLNKCIYQTLRVVFPYVRPIPGNINYYLASRSRGILEVSSDESIRRFEESGIETKFLTNEHLENKLDGERLTWFKESLNRVKKTRLNEDFTPSAVFYELWIWNEKFSPKAGYLFRWSKDLNLLKIFFPLGVLSSLLMILRKRGLMSRGKIIATTVFSSGFYGMAFNMILILALQSIFGYVYHLIGLITAMFMMGLSLGSSVMTRSVDKIRDDVSFLWRLEVLMLFFCIAVPSILQLLTSRALWMNINTLLLSALFVMSLLNGLIIGVQFSLANKIYLKHNPKLGETAGVIYASDSLGACFGAFLGSVMLLPIIGIVQTCFIVFGLKLISLVLTITLKE